MAIRTSQAVWEGNLKEGEGYLKLGSGVFEGPFSFNTRFENEPGTNPEELIGAALAGCFSMYLAAILADSGFSPKRISSLARVFLTNGPTISKIELITEADIYGISEKVFQDHIVQAKKNCPVSKALAGTEISVEAKLV